MTDPHTDPRTELADRIAALADPYEHAETIQLRSPIPNGRPAQTVRIHRVRFPSLLDQLALAVEPSTGVGVARGYESAPAARIEAIDMLASILEGIASWTNTYRDPRRALRRLVGDDSLTDRSRVRLLRDVGTWTTWARITTGWDTPPRRLRVPCPVCTQRGTIRVRLDPQEAVCIECRTVWESATGTIGLLAEYVRHYNNSEQP